jgi:radical SAM protein with 4Fe4S-binding SPASM domain
MTKVQDALESLSRQYNIIGTIDLGQSSFFDLHGFLKSVHQECYQALDRIVVVHGDADVYDYTNAPGQNIVQLQKYAREIDISNCFIVVVSGDADINQGLKQARDAYAPGDTVIDSICVDAEFIKQTSPAQDTFCILPWMHLYVGPDGNVLPCCVADQRLPLGNIKQESISSIMNGPAAQTLRSNMLNGQRSPECEFCYNRESHNLPGLRIGHNKKYGYLKDPAASAVVNNFKPVFLDVRLNNICNLKCRMCSSYYSSSIAQEDAEIFGKSVVRNTIMINQQRRQYLQDILTYIPSVNHIYFAGGEPLLAPEHYQIVDSVLAQNKNEVSLSYNTNLTTLKFRDRNVLDLWNNFKQISLGVSIDAEGAVAEYVRHGCEWTAVESNLFSVKTHCPHIQINIASTLGFMNVASLIALQQRWYQQGIVLLSQFSVSMMTSPAHLTVRVLPAHHKLRLEQAIQAHIKWCNSIDQSLSAQWQNVIEYMCSQDDSHHLSEFRRLTGILDQHRNESFANVFPEFNDLMHD